MSVCKDCKGTGVIPLFTSLAKCGACAVHQKKDPLSNLAKQKLISDYIRTPAGRAKLAVCLTPHLRTRRDTNSVGRKTFSVKDLPDGALPQEESKTEKQRVVSEYLKTPEGRAKLFASLTSPKRCGGRDYKTIDGQLHTKLRGGKWVPEWVPVPGDL